MIFGLLGEPIALLGFILAILIGLTVHEFAHAWMAYRLGDYTAKYAGRLSLNPSRHLDAAGTIFLFLIGFGWGKPVPVNTNALRGKYDELKVALAGPCSNILVAFIFLIPLHVSAEVLGYSITLMSNTSPLFFVMRTIIEINLLLAAFNLIPLAPLDGSAILRALAPYSWQPQIRRMEHSGPMILFGVIFIEYALRVSILFPIIIGIMRFFEYVLSGIIITPIINLIEYLATFF